MAANPDYDKTFRCDVGGGAGELVIVTSLRGESLNKAKWSDRIIIVTSLRGTAIEGGLANVGGDRLLVTTGIRGEAFSEYPKSNWVGWSKIGDITFVQDLTNDSGYRPMSWPGIIYNILKLGKYPIVYGNSGITMMVPVADPAPSFGFKDIFTFGLKNRTAVCGNDKRHFFIDKRGCLWKLTEEGPKSLGYEEFLSPMTDPVMFYSEVEQLVYISDATAGYVLSESGLGGGYAGITAVQYMSGVKVVASPADLTSPLPLHIVTDTIDLNYRGMKTIEYIHIGTDTDEDLYAAIDYRYDKKDDFTTSAFTKVNKEGVAFTRVAGVDFRVRVKTLTYNQFDIDYINIHYKVTDKRYVRGAHGVFENGN